MSDQLPRSTRPARLLGKYRTTTLRRALLMLLVDLAGYSIFWVVALLRRWRGSGFDPDKVKRIAVFRLDGIGDLILSIPAIAALREAFPDSHITLVVNQWSKGLAGLIPGPDEVVTSSAVMFKMFKGEAKLRDVWSERKELRKLGKEGQYDLAIDLRGDFLSIVSANWLGATYIASRPSRAGGFLLTNSIDQPREGTISEVELNLEFISKLTGKETSVSKPHLADISGDPLESCAAKTGLSAGDYIGMAVAAPYQYRMYPAEKWVEVIGILRETTDLPILILGAPGDRELCESIASRAEGDVRCLAGEFSLLESAACIKGARVFVGNDGGLIHIASAYDRPVVQLFGPANAVCFGHHDENEVVIQKECPHNPCAESHCAVPDRWCMARIEPAEVAKAVAELLDSGPPSA